MSIWHGECIRRPQSSTCRRCVAMAARRVFAPSRLATRRPPGHATGASADEATSPTGGSSRSSVTSAGGRARPPGDSGPIVSPLRRGCTRKRSGRRSGSGGRGEDGSCRAAGCRAVPSAAAAPLAAGRRQRRPDEGDDTRAAARRCREPAAVAEPPNGQAAAAASPGRRRWWRGVGGGDPRRLPTAAAACCYAGTGRRSGASRPSPLPAPPLGSFLRGYRSQP